MYKIPYLSPMIPFFDLAETGRFSRDILDFSVLMDSTTYAIWQKENITVHFLTAGTVMGLQKLTSGPMRKPNCFINPNTLL